METIDFNEVIKQNIEVVGERLIGVADTNKNGLLSKDGFMYRGTISNVNDLNGFTQAGYYHINKNSEGDTSTWPEGVGISSCLLEVYNISFSGGTRVVQRLTVLGINFEMYERFYGNTLKWSEWVNLIN